MHNTKAMIIGFQEIDKTKIALVGGKGANLGELSRIKGVLVPEGFCVTTEAYKKVTENNAGLNILLDELRHLKADERGAITEISAKIRKVIQTVSIPEDIANVIAGCLNEFTEKECFAVRSSATAEDLPTASFAGQQDTYLNIFGKENILIHISKCWASLYTERAITYRLQNGIDHRNVHLAVVVQKMIFPQAAGIMFSADPLTGNRKIISIDGSYGLGEALASGLVNADSYKVCDGKIIDKKISLKKLAIYALAGGGTEERKIEPFEQNKQALTDEQILELAGIGKQIAEHFGSPQDIEWCLADDAFYIVQSRPITTLYPVPEAEDQENHLYISVGHQQMMTDAMKPLGMSFWLLMTPPKTRNAGGRLFVDVTPMLAAPGSRDTIINTLGKFDPLIKDAITTIIERGDFIKALPNDETEPGTSQSNKAAALPDYKALNEYDPTIVAELIKGNETSLEALKQNIQAHSGPALFDFILEDIGQLKKSTAKPRSFGVIMTGMNAAHWINEKMLEWLGEKNAADTTSQSVPGNITSEMGLELLDVADVIGSYPAVMDYLQGAVDNTFPDDLLKLDGGAKARDTIYTFLDKYGMRCPGEIDITKTRWSENPAILIPLILSNIKNHSPGASKRRFEQGRQEALEKEKELLDRLRQLPDGEQKAKETKLMIDLVRNYAGYREYPKYAIISRFFVYKQAILKEAAQLVQAKVVHEKEDLYYLNFEELKEAVRTKKLDYELIDKRKEEYESFKKLSPPRVITSDGEIITGRYKREDFPVDALVGLAVSSGIIEGRARIVLNLEAANLEEGDILVTSFTDPSWTPVFVSIKGLVTEVGGLMSHGAVIAREYGIPTVVGVEHATKLIKDGQRIRINGTHGHIEIL